jgi:hypothetical protein
MGESHKKVCSSMLCPWCIEWFLNETFFPGGTYGEHTLSACNTSKVTLCL